MAQPHVVDGTEFQNPECHEEFCYWRGEERRVVMGRPFLSFIPKLLMNDAILDIKATVFGNTHPWPLSEHLSLMKFEEIQFLGLCAMQA